MGRNIFGILMALFVAAGLAFAAPVGASTTAGTPVTLGTTTVGTASAWGGNITQVNLTINSSTQRWQGFYGSVTGSLRLASGSNSTGFSTVKTWTVSNLRGQVYASTSSNVDFTAVNSTAVTLADVDSAFSFLSGFSDAAANTGTDNANPAFNVSQYTVAGNSRPLITTNSNASAGVWKEVVLAHGANLSNPTNLVFVGLLNNSGVAYNGASANYQIIVPENSVGENTATTYYFYGEVN